MPTEPRMQVEPTPPHLAFLETETEEMEKHSLILFVDSP